MRQVLRIHLTAGSQDPVGTYHPPQKGGETHGTVTRPGVLFINFGQFDRAGPANLAVDLADRLAECGYPTFRFDLPGLGDSPGDLPEDFESYWAVVEQGGQAAWTCQLAAALKQQFFLPGLLLGGLCGGALTAIFAAARFNSHISGLLLFDIQLIRSRQPLAKAATTAPSHQESPEPQAQLHPDQDRRRNASQWLSSVARASRCHGFFRLGRDVTECMVAPFSKPCFPPDANLPLIGALQKLRSNRLPMLMVFAPGANPRILKRDLFPLNRRRRVTIIDIAKTNHLFTSGGGKQLLVDQVQRWVSTHFPVATARIMPNLLLSHQSSQGANAL